MTLKPSLIKALTKATKTVLKLDSDVIVLIPHQTVNKGHGVIDHEPRPAREPQVLGIEPVGATLSGISGTNVTTPTDGANVFQWDYEIYGPPDAQIEINDTFTKNGTIYRVTSIKPVNGYERRGTLIAIGGDPSYGA